LSGTGLESSPNGRQKEKAGQVFPPEDSTEKIQLSAFGQRRVQEKHTASAEADQASFHITARVAQFDIEPRKQCQQFTLKIPVGHGETRREKCNAKD
jgi:hypothetical protein